MLQFTQAGSAWACEFEVTDKINLHIENAEGILLYQRTAPGKFALIKGAPTSTGPVFDYDLEGLVYPKHIRVICSSLPTYAEVVSDGEITEIKSQTKEVEITANGTTQVAPDAGFSYLTGVSIKTNVLQSGGSGGGGKYINDMLTEFYSIDWDRAEELGFDASSDSGFSAAIKSIIGYFALGKGSAMGMNILFNMSFFFANYSALSFLDAGGFCPIKVMEMGPEKVFNTFDDVIASNKGDYDISGIFTRITEEEFYTI